MRNAMRNLAVKLNFGMDKVVPDSFIFAAGLTFIVFIMGVTMTDSTPFQMIQWWSVGFWGFLMFSMQMVLVLVAGFVLATSPVGQKGLAALCRLPKNSLQATILITITCGLLAYISWGLGVVGAAFISRELARNIRRVNFKLIVAAGYSGYCVGALGLSTSQSLIVSTPGHFLEHMIGIIRHSHTAFHPMTLIPTLGGMLIVLPLLFWLIHPDDKDVEMLDEGLLNRFDEEAKASAKTEKLDRKNMTPAQRMDNSPIVNILIAAMGFSYIIWWFATEGFNLTLNIFNFTLLMGGVLLHWTPARLIAAFQGGVSASYGIVLQFPFYAGIQGMMGASGLVGIIAGWFVSISTTVTFPIWTYISAFIVNFFIPSSGGIFMIQGPIMAEATVALGVAGEVMINSFTAGEIIGNIIQPFWAIPILGMAGLKMKDIMGYCIIASFILSIVYFATYLIIL